MERGWLVKDSVDGLLNSPPEADAKQLKEIRGFTDEVVKRVPDVRRMEFEEFVDTCAPDRRGIYERAMVVLASTETLTERHAHIKLFVKAEKINLTDKPDPAPRMIQPRDPIYNLHLGCYLRPIEHQIYHAIDTIWRDKLKGHERLRCVFKGMNAEEMGAQIKLAWDEVAHVSPTGRVVAVTFDAARWDQHVGVAALKEEHRVYNSLHQSKELAWLLRQQLVTKGSTVVTQDTPDGESGMRYRIKYKRKGGRCSGDMNTGLGNVLMATGLMYTALKDYDCFLINNGDDCVVLFTAEAYEQWDLRKEEFYNKWTKWGFTMLMEGNPTSVLERVVFCQMFPLCVSGKWRMIRKIDSVDKDTLVVGKDTSSIELWLHCVGVGGRIANAGVPVQNAFYRAFPESKRGARGYEQSRTKHNKMQYLTRGMDVRLDGEIDESTRISYYLGTGILPSDQIAFENDFAALKRGDAFTRSIDEQEHQCRLAMTRWVGAWGRDT